MTTSNIANGLTWKLLIESDPAPPLYNY